MNLTNCLLCFLIGAFLSMSAVILKDVNKTNRQFNDYINVLTKYSKDISTIAKKSKQFEATGFETEILDDGRVKVVFLKKLAKSDHEKDTDFAEFREIIMPAWMFAQVIAEGTLKLGFDALEEKAKLKGE